MRDTRCSVRQLGAAVFTALLAPASTLPALLCREGVLGWLAPLVLFLPAAWAARRIAALGPDGLAGQLKGPAGRLALTLYYIWAVALCALTAGGCTDRLSRTDYGWAPPWLLALALTAMCAYLIRRGPGAFFRAVQIFFLALLAVLILVLALGVVNLRLENLAPKSGDEAAGPVRGTLPTGAALSVAVLAAFFPREARKPGESPFWRWLLGWCLAAAGLCAVVLGVMGPALAAKAPLPFFLALQGLRFPGGLQRLEALGTAAWILSDLTLLGMAALACREMTGGRSWTVLPALAAILAGGCLLPNALVKAAEPVLLGANLVLGAVIPVLLPRCVTGVEKM